MAFHPASHAFVNAFHKAIVLINHQAKAIIQAIKPKPAKIASSPTAAAALSSSVVNLA